MKAGFCRAADENALTDRTLEQMWWGQGGDNLGPDKLFVNDIGDISQTTVNKLLRGFGQRSHNHTADYSHLVA